MGNAKEKITTFIWFYGYVAHHFEMRIVLPNTQSLQKQCTLGLISFNFLDEKTTLNSYGINGYNGYDIGLNGN